MHASAIKVRSLIARLLGARVPEAPARKSAAPVAPGTESSPLFSLGETRQELVASYRTENEPQ